MEIWKDVVGYESLYEISNIGNIKNSDGFLLNKYNVNGYFNVMLYKNKIGKQKKIHRLVSISFIQNTENKKEVNHINGIKTDNRVENLEWCTRSENMKHAFNILGINSNLKGKLGELNTLSKKVYQYNLNGKLIKIWNSSMDIERDMNISNKKINDCCKLRRKTTGGFIWKHL